MTFITIDQTDKEEVPSKPRPIDIETIAKLNQENKLLLEKYRELEEAYGALNENYNHLSKTGEASELSISFQEKCEENKKLTTQNEKLQACIKKQKSVVEAHGRVEELLKKKENENKTLRETNSKLSYQVNELNASLSKQSESNAATSDYPRIVAELTQKFQSLYETMQEQAKQAELQAGENNKLKLENEGLNGENERLNGELEELQKLHLDLTEKFGKCDKVIKDLNKKVADCNSRKDDFNHMFNEHRTLKLKYEKLRAKYSSLEDESNTVDGKELASEYIKILSVNKELTSRVTTLADELESIRRLSDGLRRRNENLENESRVLKEELLVAHSALQAAKRQSTESCHTSVELVKQIKSLQRSLQVFTSVKGTDFTINKEASMKLLREYDDYSIVDGQFPKLLLSCVLQRKILELIFDYTNNFFKEIISAFGKASNGNRNRIALTHQLVSLTNNVSVIQAGDIDPSKIKDVNYNSLRSHIFENVKPLVDKILSVMNDCRSIKSSRKSRFYEEVINLVFNAISLYAFPTNNQSPVLEFVFFDSGTLFDEEKMEGACGDDISSDRAEIAVCYFPLIKSPGSDMVFSKAEVRMREILKTNGGN